MQQILFDEYTGPTCTRCSRYINSKSVCIPAKVVGEGPPQMLVIGEAPGEEEDKSGEPFVGPSGQKLRHLLAESNVSSYVLTNAVRCVGNKTTPTGKEIQTCRIYLKQDISQYQDIPILLVGSIALKAMQYDDKIQTHVNRVWFDNNINRWLGCIIHPAAVLRNPQLENVWREGRNTIASLLQAKTFVIEKPSIVIKNMLPQKIEGRWYLDTETNMLDMFHPSFLCTHICIITENPHVAYLIDRVSLIPDCARKILGWWRENPPIVQNAPFDCLVLLCSAKEMMPLQSFPMQELRVYPHLKNTDANLSLVRQLEGIGVRRYWGEVKKHVVADVGEYVIRDTEALRVLYHKYQTETFPPAIIKRLNEIVSLAHLIDYVGIPVDVKKIQAHIERLGNEAEKWSQQLGIERHVLDSPQKLSKHLGIAKTDEETLAVSENVPPEVSNGIRAYRHATKLQTFASNLLGLVSRKHPMGWECIHASFNPLGTNSGRWSASSWNPDIGFNPQTIPPELRDIIQPPTDDYVLLECDYSQVELRVAAWAAGVSKMKKAFLSGRDLHRQTAELVFGQSTDESRKKAKAVNFGFLYGMQAEKFRIYAKTMFGIDFTIEEAEEIRRRFFEEYPELNTYYARIERQVQVLRHVRTEWGRVRHFLPLPQNYRQAINFYIQSTAADIALDAGRRMLPLFSVDTLLPCLQVHDSYIFILNKKWDTDGYRNFLKQEMEKTSDFPFFFDVPLVVDIKQKEKDDT